MQHGRPRGPRHGPRRPRPRHRGLRPAAGGGVLTARGLLAAARDLVERRDEDLAGLWPRAAALAARRALEEGLDLLWAARAPGLERASARAQLACLPSYLQPRELADDVAYAWTVLSDACHHHPYEVGPTAQELRVRMDVVERFLDKL